MIADRIVGIISQNDMISCCHCRLSTYALSRAYSQMLCCYRDYLLLLLSFVIAGLSYGSMLILPVLAVAC